MIEVKYVVLLFDDRYAHCNLPTMWELNAMMMQVRVLVIHLGRQYTNRSRIWQAHASFQNVKHLMVDS